MTMNHKLTPGIQQTFFNQNNDIDNLNGIYNLYIKWR